MVIERNIIKKVGEYNNIAICDERTVRIELTEAEIEEAYRIREREYLEEDIKNGVYVLDGTELTCIKKAKRHDRSRPVSEMLLMMFRSAARDRRRTCSEITQE